MSGKEIRELFWFLDISRSQFRRFSITRSSELEESVIRNRRFDWRQLYYFCRSKWYENQCAVRNNAFCSLFLYLSLFYCFDYSLHRNPYYVQDEINFYWHLSVNKKITCSTWNIRKWNLKKRSEMQTTICSEITEMQIIQNIFNIKN